MSSRVYVAGDWNVLREAIATNHAIVAKGGQPMRDRLPGHAVTSALREALPDCDEEELEHYAMTEAAQDSLHNFQDEGEPMRRLVLVFDVAEPELVEDGISRAYACDVSIPRDVVAWLVDAEGAEEVVSEAVAALALTTDVESALERCLDHELASYGADEADQVLALR